MRLSSAVVFIIAISEIEISNTFNINSNVARNPAFVESSRSRGSLTRFAAKVTKRKPGPLITPPNETTGIKALGALGTAGACLLLIILAPFANIEAPEAPSIKLPTPKVTKEVKSKPSPKAKDKSTSKPRTSQFGFTKPSSKKEPSKIAAKPKAPAKVEKSDDTFKALELKQTAEADKLKAAEIVADKKEAEVQETKAKDEEILAKRIAEQKEKEAAAAAAADKKALELEAKAKAAADKAEADANAKKITAEKLEQKKIAAAEAAADQQAAKEAAKKAKAEKLAAERTEAKKIADEKAAAQKLAAEKAEAEKAIKKADAEEKVAERVAVKKEAAPIKAERKATATKKTSGLGVVTGGEKGGKVLPAETVSDDVKSFLQKYK